MIKLSTLGETLSQLLDLAWEKKLVSQGTRNWLYYRLCYCLFSFRGSGKLPQWGLQGRRWWEERGWWEDGKLLISPSHSTVEEWANIYSWVSALSVAWLAFYIFVLSCSQGHKTEKIMYVVLLLSDLWHFRAVQLITKYRTDNKINRSISPCEVRAF